MRIAVTGATGVLGQQAVEALVAAGHEVTGVTRRDRGVPVIEGRGGTAVIADVFDSNDLSRAFRGHDVVINTLAKVPVGMAAMRPLAWREDDRLHMEASVAIAEAAARSGVRRLIRNPPPTCTRTTARTGSGRTSRSRCATRHSGRACGRCAPPWTSRPAVAAP